MFFYNTDNLIHLKQLISDEKNRINNIVSLYNNKKTTLLGITNSMITVTNVIAPEKSDDFFYTVTLLKDSFEELDTIFVYTKNLIKILNNVFELCNLNTTTLTDIDTELTEYNYQLQHLETLLNLYEKNITTILNTTIDLTISIASIPQESAAKKEILSENNSRVHDFSVQGDKNILIVSETDQLAYLPYKYSDIEKILQNSNGEYQSYQDVIEDLYIIPLKYFKNASISRFREAFKLVRNKEHKSITKALDLGLELMFKYTLNPIIIAACRNLDELDIYLDCLDENELFDFDCFDIRFEIAPQISKHQAFEF